MHPDTIAYNRALSPEDRVLCDLLARRIETVLPEAENKVWHAHPVWFIEGNPVAGYSRLKDGVRLLFWSGRSFVTPGLTPEGKFQAAEVRYSHSDQVQTERLDQWLQEAREIQWDYRNIVRRKGVLERLK